MGYITCLKLPGSLLVNSSQPGGLTGRPGGGRRRGSRSAPTRRLCRKLRTSGMKCVLESFRSATSHGQKPVCQMEQALRTITQMGIHCCESLNLPLPNLSAGLQVIRSCVMLTSFKTKKRKKVFRLTGCLTSAKKAVLCCFHVMLACSFNRPFLIHTYSTWAQSAHERQTIQFVIDPACCGNHASGLCGITRCLGSPVVLAAAAFGSVR